MVTGSIDLSLGQATLLAIAVQHLLDDVVEGRRFGPSGHRGAEARAMEVQLRQLLQHLPALPS